MTVNTTWSVVHQTSESDCKNTAGKWKLAYEWKVLINEKKSEFARAQKSNIDYGPH